MSKCPVERLRKRVGEMVERYTGGYYNDLVCEITGLIICELSQSKRPDTSFNKSDYIKLVDTIKYVRYTDREIPINSGYESNYGEVTVNFGEPVTVEKAIGYVKHSCEGHRYAITDIITTDG